LNADYAIGVRHGCFCAHPSITRLLKVPEAEARGLHAELRRGLEPELPGAVRASIGLGTTVSDLDALIGALDEISRRR
jgi:selenocysteine lyase/cysteine desulfurase